VNIDGAWHDVNVARLGDSPRYVLMLGDRVLEVLVEEDVRGFNLQIGGATFEVETVRSRGRPRDPGAVRIENGRWTLMAPLTGVVMEIRIKAGDSVEQDDVVLIIEAMKMLNELRARVTGEVEAVHVAERDRVEIGTPLLEIRVTDTEAAAEPQ
jgi:biotin carboxyl carrier protein